MIKRRLSDAVAGRDLLEPVPRPEPDGDHSQTSCCWAILEVFYRAGRSLLTIRLKTAAMASKTEIAEVNSTAA